MEPLEARLRTTKLGYGRMRLPEEAEEGDEETAELIRRDKQQQEKEEQHQKRKDEEMACVMKA